MMVLAVCLLEGFRCTTLDLFYRHQLFARGEILSPETKCTHLNVTHSATSPLCIFSPAASLSADFAWISLGSKSYGMHILDGPVIHANLVSIGHMAQGREHAVHID